MINSLVASFFRGRLKKIDYFRENPVEVQHSTFRYLVESAKNTEWGKKYSYEKILKEGLKIFKEIVPISDYDNFKTFIEKIRDGKENILWNTSIRWFAKSSGTTSDKSKFIPITKEGLKTCHYRGGKDVLALYFQNYPDSRLFTGKSLIIGGSQQIEENQLTNQFYGDLSAVLMSNLPFWVNYFRTPHLSIALMSEWEAKLEKMAKATIPQNVTNISGVPSWTLVLIKKIFEMTGKTNLLEVWKNLELFIHGGVSFVPYREQYRRVIDSDKMRYMETYNASEGFFGIQDSPETDDMLLMLDYGIFYEFIPMDEFDSENPKVLSLEEVEKDKNYAIVISTNCGLWRYLIGDTVKFTSLFPFKFKITGRTRHFINAFGEEIIIDNAEKALQIACEQTNAAVREYTAAPIYMGENQKGAHQWLIEFEKLPNNLSRFTEILDSALKSVNSDYEAKRHKGLSLDLPVVVVAREGLFYEWLKNKGKLGGQHKIPRLANHRNHIEELLKMNDE